MAVIIGFGLTIWTLLHVAGSLTDILDKPLGKILDELKEIHQELESYKSGSFANALLQQLTDNQDVTVHLENIEAALGELTDIRRAIDRTIANRF